MLSLMLPGVESNNFCLNSDTVSVHFAGGEAPSSPDRSHQNVSPTRPPHHNVGPLLTSTPLVQPICSSAGHLPVKKRDSGSDSSGKTAVPAGLNECSRVDSDCDLISGSRVEENAGPLAPGPGLQLVHVLAADGSSNGSSPAGSCEVVAATPNSAAAVFSSASTIRNGKLKRVSFGSSKGSMVETLVYDCDSVLPLKEEEVPLKEEDPEVDVDVCPNTSRQQQTLQQDSANKQDAVAACPQGSASRLRVTYYESRRPLFVAGESLDPELVEESGLSSPQSFQQPVLSESAATSGAEITTATLHDMPTTYVVQTVDSGWENPFRPGGELSLEADNIVRAIQSGKPLASHLVPDGLRSDGTTVELNGATDMVDHAPQAQTPPCSPVKHRNGSEVPRNGTLLSSSVSQETEGSTVEHKHTLVAPEDPSQVEQVRLKKRGKCCTIQ